MSKTVRFPRHWRNNRHRSRQPTFRSRSGRHFFDPRRRGDRAHANSNGTRSRGVRRTGSRSADGRLPRAIALRRFRCQRRRVSQVRGRGGFHHPRRRARALREDAGKRLYAASACWMDRPASESVIRTSAALRHQARRRVAGPRCIRGPACFPHCNRAGAGHPSRES